MNETKKIDKWIGILSISTIIIIVLVFVLTVSNMHVAKGTYGDSRGHCICKENDGTIIKDEETYRSSCANIRTDVTCEWTENDSSSSGSSGESTTETTYSIYFAGNGGTVPSPINCVRTHDNITNTNTYTCGGNSDNTITLPTSSKSGYTFTGWSQGNASCSNPLKGTIKPTVTTTYYACFVETANGGTHAPSGVVYVYFKKNSSIVKTCTTDTNGKLDSSCISSAISICSTWSDVEGISYNQSGLSNKSFTTAKDTTAKNLYCNTGSTPTPTNNPGKTPTDAPTVTPTDKPTTTSTNNSTQKSTINNPTNETSDNPQTGNVGIIVAWVVGLSAIVYSLWYFKKSSSMN